MYEIHLNVNGVDFSRDDIKKRYGLTNPGRENRSIHHVFSIIQQYERTYGEKDTVSVSVIFSTNGKETMQWIHNTQ
jgi:hypothetical protein